MITSHTALCGPLWAFINSRVTFADPDAVIEPPAPFEGADYYLLASLLQKAIRRSDFVLARRAGHQLYEIAPSRLWYRLMVIALEDIGIGDPDVAMQLIALSNRPRWREEFGGDLPVLDRLLAESCLSVKDRTADYASFLISEGHAQPFPKAPPQSSKSVLLETVASLSLPPLTRLDAAVRVAAATKGRDLTLTAKLAGLEALFRTFREMACPPLLLDACKAYTQKSSDTLPLVIPLIWAIWTETGAEPSSAPQAKTHVDLGGGMPSYAFDPLHTRPGKAAVTIFLQSHPRLRWNARQVGAAVWNIESSVCSPLLKWTEGARLQEAAEREELLRTGVPPEECAALMTWVEENFYALSSIRQAIWRKISREGYWTDTVLKQVNPLLPGSGDQNRG